jgi:anti-sigma factor RsiW
MTCTETRDLFSALADDALTPSERAALDAHLAGCAECRRELAGLLRTVKLVRAMDPVHAPAGFVDRVVAAAQPARSHGRLVRRLMRPWPTLPLSAAALLLIGGLAVLLFRGSPEQQRAAHDQLEAPSARSSERDVAAARREEPPATVTSKSDAELSQHYAAPPKSETTRSNTTAPTTTRTDAQAPRAADKRAETTVTPAAQESREAKRELSDRGQDMRGPAAGGRSAAAPSVADPQPRTSVTESPATTERHAAAESPATAMESFTRDRQGARPPVGAAPPAPASATAKAQATPQSAPLSRTGPMTGVPAAPPDVTARLRVANVGSAERALIELAARAGGRQTGRRIDGGRLVVELAVPREAYAEFVRDAAALGAVSIESQATDRSMLAVAVTLSN